MPQQNYSIQIQNEFESQYGQAVYYPRKSTATNHLFGFNLHQGILEFLKHIQNLQYLLERKKTWVHELAHCLDFHQVCKTQNETFDYKTEKNFLFDFMMKWHLYRVEGLARLLEYYLENRSEKDNFWNPKLTFANQAIMNSLIKNKTEFPEYNSNFRLHPYQLGPHLLLNALYYTDEKNRGFYDDIFDKVKVTNRLSAKEFGSIDIIHHLINISLEEVIISNIQEETSLPFSFELHQPMNQLLYDILIKEGFTIEENTDLFRSVFAKRTIYLNL